MKQNKQEIWRDIPNYKGYYEVSNQGRVRSLDRWVIFKNGRKQFYKGKMMEGSFNRGGYEKLNLSKGGKLKTFLIHQIVAVCFLGHKPDGHQLVVDHINGDKIDNRVENLQIVTNRDNNSICFRKDRNILSSKFVGVHFDKTSKKWQAQIHFKGKNIKLGFYSTEIDASDTYQKALAKINDGTFKIEDYRASFTSKFKGITFHKASQKWIAKPYFRGKQVYLGIHTTEESAYQAILLHEAIQPILV